jgi:hypothetical protein
MAAIMEKYYFSKRAVEPVAYIRLTDNWIEVSVRYITDVRSRREVKSRLMEHFLREIEGASGRFSIASESIAISDFPGTETRASDNRSAR